MAKKVRGIISRIVVSYIYVRVATYDNLLAKAGLGTEPTKDVSLELDFLEKILGVASHNSKAFRDKCRVRVYAKGEAIPSDSLAMVLTGSLRSGGFVASEKSVVGAGECSFGVVTHSLHAMS